MNKKSTRTMLTMLAAGWLFFAVSGNAEPAAAEEGQALFQQHCSICHPNGGNIINPAKPLDGETLKANGINDESGIIATMRKPGPGMTPFGPDLIPQEEAEEIAEYILETF